MGKLYSARLKIEKAIFDRQLNESQTKGAISLKTGFLINLIKEETPDDVDKIQKLNNATRETLGFSI